MAEPVVTKSIELQHIVGAECAHCHRRILVDTDGRNCKRCGLALHRVDCHRAHKPACKGEAVAARKPAAHDYDEALPLEFTPAVIAAFSLPAFLAGFGVQRLSTGPAGELAADATHRMGLGAAALTVGVVGAFAAYLWAVGRQRSAK